LFSLVSVRAADNEILLWSKGAPGSEGQTAQQVINISASGEQSVFSVHQPSITPYLPAKGTGNGAVVLVIPGGGHRTLAITHEGYNVAEWLKDHGVAAFVLKYRLARDTNSPYKIDPHALADTQRAIRLIRSRATEWEIDPKRLGVMGFSAGGELASLACLQFATNALADANDPLDQLDSKPNFQALIYPGQSKNILPTKESPPVFLACGFNDRQDIAEGLADVYLRFKKVGVPAELHIYSSAGHGFGYRDRNKTPAGAWLARFNEWMADSGFLKAK
ncbi:MAG TPA: alpha/beta hydrolase, partial [Candidatus Limnocylindria bacterium]|nr:alpha/beta hydrolase [Candidatus Limnocylindria bacterium]